MAFAKKYTISSLPYLHSWGPDYKSVCVAHSHGDLEIYDLASDKLKLKHNLKSHKHRVTGIDWHQGTNRILTCGEDRNAYVWSYNKNKWEPELVVLRVNRAAMCCQWSPNGETFAVGTSAKTLSVCVYDEQNNFWVSKSCGKKSKIKSTVTSIAWHPSGKVIACGGTDFRCRVINAEVNSKQFGNLLYEIPSIGFINCVAWSNKSLAFASQSARLTLITLDGDYNEVAKHEHQLKGLPITSMYFDAKGNLIAGGHDHLPLHFEIKNNKIQAPTSFEVKKKEVQETNIFKKRNKKKSKGGAAGHSFAINDVRPIDSGFTTVAAGDGGIYKWSSK